MFSPAARYNLSRTIENDPTLGSYLIRPPIPADHGAMMRAALAKRLTDQMTMPIASMVGLAKLIRDESREVQIQSYGNTLEAAGRKWFCYTSILVECAKAEAGIIGSIDSHLDVMALLSQVITPSAAEKQGQSIRLELRASDIPITILVDSIRLAFVVHSIIKVLTACVREAQVLIEPHLEWDAPHRDPRPSLTLSFVAQLEMEPPVFVDATVQDELRGAEPGEGVRLAASHLDLLAIVASAMGARLLFGSTSGTIRNCSLRFEADRWLGSPAFNL